MSDQLSPDILTIQSYIPLTTMTLIQSVNHVETYTHLLTVRRRTTSKSRHRSRRSARRETRQNTCNSPSSTSMSSPTTSRSSFTTARNELKAKVRRPVGRNRRIGPRRCARQLEFNARNLLRCDVCALLLRRPASDRYSTLSAAAATPCNPRQPTAIITSATRGAATPDSRR